MDSAHTNVKVYLRPTFAGPDRGEGGIRRWVDNQHQYLGDYGVEIVDSEEIADVVACHAGDLVKTDKPFVGHNHGLYATGAQAWSRWEWMMNANVIEILRRSDIATVPSMWVADQVARGLSIHPRVLYAGIDPESWPIGDDGGYVLWNKTRVDPVCDPEPLNRLARRLPKQRFVSTFSDPTLSNVHRTGRLPYDEAKAIMRNATVLLSTTRETFGIATIEAMAAGVPILGWRFGGNLDIVSHGVDGYLAEVGDYDDLIHGLEVCTKRRAEMGAAAREKVLSRFTWRRAIEECAELYHEAAGLWTGRPRTSVIVTCYKLEEYLDECLTSLQAQTDRDWECIVVDDCSPGPCQEIVHRMALADSRIKYLKTPRNLYLAGARNHGIRNSSGRYILCLDADDQLNPRALEVLADHLDTEPGHDIAYGAFELIEPDGKRWVSSWPRQFSWEGQITHKNQLYYAALYRRRVWERTGGYRERCTTAEDADFWCRATSFGARPYQVSHYPCLLYRNRPDSMSHVEAEPDWTAWYPWSADRTIAPFGCVGTPLKGTASWPVRLHTEPKVSVIIPVGPGHGSVVRDALDSVMAQTMPEWEAIVVNDSGDAIDLNGFPWAKVLETKGRQGPAIARNLGLHAATAPLVAFLDADDYLQPEFLARHLDVQAQVGGYVYSDWWQINGDGSHERKAARDYEMMALLEEGLFHAITGVYPKAAVLDLVGGFDAESGGWEDWDLIFALATNEVCGTRIPEALWNYRYWSGQRREDGTAAKETNAKILRTKWREWTIDGGRKLMGCKKCGGGGGASRVATPMRAVDLTMAQVNNDGMVLLEYTGKSAGIRSYRGASGTLYRFGSDAAHKRKFVYTADAEKLGQLREFRVITIAEATASVPEAEPLVVRQSQNRLVESAV